MAERIGRISDWFWEIVNESDQDENKLREILTGMDKNDI